MHPSTYIPGFPEDTPALNLSFEHATLADAVAADCAAWAAVEPDTLYWVPGTRIIGAIYVENTWYGVPYVEKDRSAYACGEDGLPRRIFGGQHGTLVAGRSAGNRYGACPDCLIVSVDGWGSRPVTWAAEQAWIDIQSNSWGPFLPVQAPMEILGSYTSEPVFVRAVEAAAARQPAFWGTGNGALFHHGVLGHPSQLTPHMTPSVIRVGGHDSGRVALWPGQGPHIVSDVCANWRVVHRSMDEWDQWGDGTSAATPYAAGIGAQIILAARRLLHDQGPRKQGILAKGEGGRFSAGPLVDGELSVAEWRGLLFATADPRPDAIEADGGTCDFDSLDTLGPIYGSTPIAWRDVPEGEAGVFLVGYGAVTPATAQNAIRILQGLDAWPDRAKEDAYFMADDQLRRALYQVNSVP